MKDLDNGTTTFTPCLLYSDHKPYGHWPNNPKTTETKKLAKALFQAVVIIAFIAVTIWFLGTLGIAKAEDAETIGFPSYWEHDTKLVTALQTQLVEYGEKVDIDGVFGAKTATAVKRLQRKYDMPVNGVVDDNFAWSFGVEGWPYDKGYTLYYMADLQSIYEQNDFEDLIYISLGGRGYDPENAENTGSHLWLYRNGELIADCPCITGDESKGHFTPLGVRHIRGRHRQETGRWSKYYWLVHLNETYFIHSLLDYYDGSRDQQVLGAHQSDGSIRVPEEFAKWLYTNERNGVAVVIDDRAFSPYGAPGSEHLLDEDSEWTDYADWEYEDEDSVG